LGEPDSRGFIALLAAFRATGGTAPAEIVDRLLQARPTGRAVSLAQLIDTGEAFGFEWRRTVWIPMFQFNPDDLSVKADAQDVRAALPSQWSGWSLASWFAAPNARLDGRNPVDMLGRHLHDVLLAALALDTGDEWSLPLAHRPQAVAAHV
jgi:hypothetical protein